MTTYFITGASGFVGRHLAARLLDDGHRVLIMVRPVSDVADLEKKGARVYRGDFTRKKELEPIFLQNKNKIDVLFHLAAMVKEAGVPDDLFYRVNVKGTENLLEAAEKFGVKRFVQVSTTGVLGDVQQFPAPVNAPYRPVDIYQKTKAEAEVRALEYRVRGRMEVVVARPGAVYGPGDLRFLKLFKLIKKGMFVIFGPGQNYLHPVYISDLVAGLILCATVENINGRIYHLAGSRYVTVQKWTDAIAVALGKKPCRWKFPLAPVMLAADIFEWLGKTFHFEPPIFRRRMEFFVKNRAFDISTAVKDLGFVPRVELAAGLAETVAGYRAAGWL